MNVDNAPSMHTQHESESQPLVALIMLLVLIVVVFVGAVVCRRMVLQAARRARSRPARTPQLVEARRKLFVHSSLISRPWGEEAVGDSDTEDSSIDEGHSSDEEAPAHVEQSTDEEAPAPTAEAESAAVEGEYSPSRKPLDDEDSSLAAPECAICLGEFSKGQIVTEANNPDCKHVYHRYEKMATECWCSIVGSLLLTDNAWNYGSGNTRNAPFVAISTFWRRYSGALLLHTLSRSSTMADF